MKRFVPPAILLLVVFACGKKEEPVPEAPPAPATQTAPQAEQSPAVPPQAGAEPSTPTAETTPSTEKAKATDGKYTVAKGDTLYSIAKKNGLNYRDLAKWNKIKNPRRLRVGQELRLAAPGR